MPADRSATLTVSVPFHVFARGPAGDVSGPAPILLALHGYAMDAPAMLAVAERFTHKGVLLVAPEGPHSTLLPEKDGSERKTSYHWGVSARFEENRATHRACVAEAIRWAVAQGGDPARVALAGFSQPCSFNYRLAIDPPHGHPFTALVGICGGIPGNWTATEPPGTAASRAARVLHISAREDSLYPMERVAGFRERLGARFAAITHSFYDGGHRVPSAATEEIRTFLAALTG